MFKRPLPGPHTCTRVAAGLQPVVKGRRISAARFRPVPFTVVDTGTRIIAESSCALQHAQSVAYDSLVLHVRQTQLAEGLLPMEAALQDVELNG